MGKKWKYGDVYEKYKEKGYNLLEEEYKNNATRMKCDDDEGYLYMLAFADILADTNPRKFIANNPFTIENIKTYLKNENLDYVLLSTEYINNSTDMRWSCGIHGEFDKKWGEFLQGKRCNTCGDITRIEKKTTPLDDVLKEITSVNPNIEILDTSGYRGLHSYFKVRCKIHTDKEWYASANNLKRGKGCSKCAKDLAKQRYAKTPEQFLKEVLAVNETVIIINPNEYVNFKTTVKCICKIHNELFDGHPQILLSGRTGCKKCKSIVIGGENHYLYDHTKTQEERDLKRHYIGEESYTSWRRRVFERDDYTCVKCGKHGGKIVAHHLDGWHWCKEKRIDVDNGVTLCEYCHDHKYFGSFHSIYGNRDNTKEQFEEFCRRNDDISFEQIEIEEISKTV